jgi:acyl carrier protein
MRVLGKSEVPEAEVDLFEAGLNSLGFVTLLMELEDEFGGFWPVEQLSRFADIAKVGALRSAAKAQLCAKESEGGGASGAPRDE